ncbi:MAG: histidinol dehydrogenase [Deltaproteobacteria bacterium]|nr:histidinol dehydrogenase [Deltaproteobacteria bacterium]
MRVIDSRDKGFRSVLSSITGRGAQDTVRVEPVVKAILDDVKRRGDRAVVEYTERFDGVDIKGALEVGGKEIDRAFKAIPRKDLALIELAASRIESFHKKQLRNSWFTVEGNGSILGTKITPLERAGIYVPGGKAAYPSTVLMNAIPARVAGVDTVVMATPPGKDGINPYALASARVAGVDRVFRTGGAQAVGALAFGTETIPKVDKITGPGNIYVATGKRLVFGTVDIDMVAGPSEILIINDGTGEPSWVAADLLSQAEHDELASSILITTSKEMAARVSSEIVRQLGKLKRRAIASASIKEYGAIIIARDLKEAVEISNGIAPEHLELFVERPFELLGLVRNAGAVFLGRNTPEAAGDYLAGPNHTLPTGGTARFSSPLGVDDFIKKTSVIGFSAEAIASLGGDIKRFAEIEGLDAHAESVKKRLRG